MTQEDLHRLRMLVTADLAECVDSTDKDEIAEIREDLHDGYFPAELSSDSYAVSMCGADGVAFGQYRTMRSIRTMVSRGLIAPGPWQRKAIAGSFDLVRLWQDTNHNGVSESDELHTLAELGVESISLEYRESRRRDRYGNVFKLSSQSV